MSDTWTPNPHEPKRLLARVPLRVPVAQMLSECLLVYDINDPLEVQLLLPAAPAPVQYRFGRELLVDAFDAPAWSPTGVDGGLVRAHREADWIRFTLRDGPSATELLHVDVLAEAAETFLHHTYRMVPLGSESQALSLAISDESIAELLR